MIIRSLISVILLQIIFCSNTNAQLQGNNWYFGDHAGITFETSPPSPLFNGALTTMEGCSTISDTTGNLLFYTDGSFIYNKNHQLMPNGFGLMGNPSASNAALIIKKPGINTIYYIFTVDAGENNFSNGYRYTIVDMSLNAGLGDVSLKNILIYSKCSEKITAVKNANGTDVWIITKDYQGDLYKVFNLSCNGLDINPVISHVGMPYINGASIRVGSMKASPDGTKIATMQVSLGWEIFEFNKVNGVLNNPLHIPFNMSCLFGVEFSPDSKSVYFSSECITVGSTTYSGGSIYQYRIDNYDSLAIINSKYLVGTSDFMCGDMQLGPDGRIYIPNQGDSSLNIITNPDLQGASCNYDYKAISLGYGHTAQRCLPAFFKDNINNSTINFTSVVSANCDLITFSGTTSLPGPVTWHWDFGDGSTSTGQSVTHLYVNGKFQVKLSVKNENICGAEGIKTQTITVNALPPVANFSYEFSCRDTTIHFYDSSKVLVGSLNKWMWDFGDGQFSTTQNPTHTYNDYGQYLVKLKVISDSVCVKFADTSILINIPYPRSSIFLGNDTTICNGQAHYLNAKSGYKNYMWQNGSTDSIYIVTQSGQYYVTATDSCNTIYYDTINIIVGQAELIKLGNDTSICSNQSLVLNAGTNFIYYLWNTGETTPLIEAKSVGEYQVTARNSFGCISKDSIKILKIFPSPILTLNKQPIVCLKQNNFINAGSGYSTYLWQDGTTDSTIIINNPGLYKLTVSNSYNCQISDSVKISNVISPPTNFLDSEFTICTNDSVIISPHKTFNEYLWNNGSTESTLVLRSPGLYWLLVKDKNFCFGSDSIIVYAKDCTPYFNIPNAFTPNRDGRNDAFKPILAGSVTEYRFTIYNRYGQTIFSSSIPENGWDGTLKGIPQNSDVFIWTCSYKMRGGKNNFSKGSVMLIR